jgi:hypothetical protein
MPGNVPQHDRRRRRSRRRQETVVPTYPNPGLEAELAYRRELLQQIGRGTRTRRNPWTTRWSRRAR